MSILTPPEHFSIVSKNIYRSSSSIHPISFTFIKHLRLKSILILTNEQPTRIFTTFLSDSNITLLQPSADIHPSAFTLSCTISPTELIKQSLEIVLSHKHLPILISCSSGIHETGVVCGILRKLQDWSLSAILAEYRSFAFQKSRYQCELFIEAFDLDLIFVDQTVKEKLTTSESVHVE